MVWHTMESNLLISVGEYLDAGWALCPIPDKSKGPLTPGWNRIENAIRSQDQAGLITSNVGLLHAYSGTACVDVDDYNLAKSHLLDNGIDLDGLLTDPQAVQIDSGRDNRCKLLYQYPEPLQYRNLATKGLELRCADSKGGSVQDVLPPSIHPNGNPYRWAGNGNFKNLPTLPTQLLDFWLSLDNSKTDTGQTITKGSRNNTLTSIAGKLRNEGIDQEAITEALLVINTEQCNPQLSISEVESIARSVSRYEPGNDDGIDDVGVIEIGDPILPNGDYCIQYVRHKIIRDMHGWGPRIVVWFTITEGDYKGSIVRAFYNIEVDGNKWRALTSSRLSREIPALFPDQRKDQISPALLRDHIILARVGLTKKGNYSTVKKLLELKQ